MSGRQAVVLAAGKGTRMESELPKVLFPVCGRPMIHYVLDALEAADVDRAIVVVGYRADLVQEELSGRAGLEFVEQTEQLGTGHAVKVCLPQLAEWSGAVAIVAGDSPLIQSASLSHLFNEYEERGAACILGTLEKEDPSGLGRIVRDGNDQFVGIVEEKDATADQRAIREVNMSTYVFDAVELVHALRELRNDNRQKEYYLTDCPGILSGENKDVRALPVLRPCESLSINTIDELAAVEAEMSSRRPSSPGAF
ncbi:MAG: NTP transferase domain-containing protein [Pirellulaceae bacterium]|nr:NTP transferase domain-containing protein [Pirellulaceae bacterium]MDP7015132.1 NTP transferase domain-containing protein [Pirellulaceae bacterium]